VKKDKRVYERCGNVGDFNVEWKRRREMKVLNMRVFGNLREGREKERGCFFL